MFPYRLVQRLSTAKTGVAARILAATCLCSAACSGDRQAFATTTCVYNQAYQENYEVDSLEVLRSDPQGCYVLIDGLDPDATELIPELADRDNQIGCYTSVGTGENWRDDFAQLEPFLVDEAWGAWAGEFFVSDVDGALPIMVARMDNFAELGCEWVEFDNMDWAQDDAARAEYGFATTAEDAESYSNKLCEYVHSLNMLCMAKNFRFEPNTFDGVTFESSAQDKDWWTSSHLQDFVEEGKLSVVVHYGETDCAEVVADYRSSYGEQVSFICEDPAVNGYDH